MADVNKALKEDILEHAKKRANELLQQYSKLRMLYSEQDGLIGNEGIMEGGQNFFCLYQLRMYDRLCVY